MRDGGRSASQSSLRRLRRLICGRKRVKTRIWSFERSSSCIFGLESIDPELLLQARRRGRVLEHQPLVRIDVAVGLLRHQGALVESAQDQLQLAGIGVDVADGKDTG